MYLYMHCMLILSQMLSQTTKARMVVNKDIHIDQDVLHYMFGISFLIILARVLRHVWLQYNDMDVTP